MQLLRRIGTAVVLIPLVLLLILKAPIPVLAVVAAIVTILSVHELLKLSEAYGIRPFHRATYVFIVIFFLFLAISPGEKPLLQTAILVYTVGFAAALAPFLFLSLGMRRVNLRDGFPAAMVSVFAFGYIALPMGFLVQIRQQWAGAFLMLYLLLIVWAGDIFAYFVGKSMGRHLMSPRISPKKTWEGTLASLAASLIVGMLLYTYALPISTALMNAHLMNRQDGYFAFSKPPLWPAILLTAALNIAAQLGDLVESLIKRGADVKDSGNLLPGHGGMLDRIDALLFAAPLLWFYVAWQAIR